MTDGIRAMKAYIDEHRSQATPFEIVQEGETPGHDHERARAIVHPFAEAGATWWTENRWSFPPSRNCAGAFSRGHRVSSSSSGLSLHSFLTPVNKRGQRKQQPINQVFVTRKDI
ncbi:MAG TPA: hypothetical protein VFN02_01720 [Ktedonobacteraceae bacterium]|nr:hypothetical protein [Ktedonobacteraceae bacterium]